MANLSRRGFLASLLASTAAVALTLPKPTVIMGFDPARDDSAAYAWFLLTDEEPQLVRWSEHEGAGDWTTSDRLRFVHQPPAQMQGWSIGA